MTFIICSEVLVCTKNGANVHRSAYTVPIRLKCRYNVLDGTLNEHPSDKTKTFAIRSLGECFVECR